MANGYSSGPRLSVRDSFDDEELTDIDDEVFIRDGKRGGILKINDESGVKRPLMAPRRKQKLGHPQTPLSFKAFLIPLCYGLMALIVLLGLMLLCILTINIFPVPFGILKNVFSGGVTLEVTITKASRENELLPCTSLATSVLWMRTMPKLTSEAPLRSLDVNTDGIDDIILGFSTGLDALDAPEFLCNLYFEGQIPCLGGVMALDGKSGETLWTHWTNHAIFSIDCTSDLTKDQMKDCIITGRGGILQAIDGRDGKTLWELPAQQYSIAEEKIILNVYDARSMTDVNKDGISDIIVSHTTQAGSLRSSRVILLSGKNGTVIKSIDFSKEEQLFIAPQILVHPDGEIIYILSSCTPNQSGGVYIISQHDLLHGNLKQKRQVQHGQGKGVLLPPILVDLTLDGTEDIITVGLDSTITAYNGLNFQPIWNYTVPQSEVISIPIPGYYDDDNVPDIMVKHQIGPGFPVYYHSLTTILSGKTGQPFLETPIKDNANGQMSGLSISVDGLGNDWFLHWSANCMDQNVNENINEKYRFLNGQTLLSQSRADLCKLRFNTTLSMRLSAMSQHVGPPGQSIYFSDDWKAVELNNSIDPRKETEKYMFSNYENTLGNKEIPPMPQRLPRIEIGEVKTDIFKNQESQGQDDQSEYILKPDEEKDLNSENLLNEFPGYKKELTDFANPEWSPNFWNIAMEPDSPGEEIRPIDEHKQFSFFGQRSKRFLIPMKPRIHLIDLKKRFGRRRSNRRPKRSTSAEDNGEKNVQRQPPTGILLPSLAKDDKTTSIDLIFSTYWLPPSEVSLVLLQQDLECIRLRQEKIMEKMELNERESIISGCLAERGINYKLYREGLDRENSKLALGQMTIYRMKLQCVCPEDMLEGQSCKNISIHQSWSEQLGVSGNGYFR
ncbi:uncharacterized protein [Fopius arisanus]|uniref:FAM234A/B beta-propeller domain-containing protein n=3 Tax=Fopius arisanus TaxID=64838 RepID=A0A9R1T0P3_9HYME|nr:PREDICTED: uncharacterized protein LOC105265139 [Fopius arisanus]